MVCAAGLGAFASEIALQEPLVGEDYVSIPVTVSTDGADQPASLQFDVTYDAANFAVVDVQVGDAAAQAGKTAVFSESGSGTLTVLVAGLNQNVITDGVVANVSLCPLSQAADTQTLFLDAVVVSDPFGNPIDILYERPPEPATIESDDDASDEARFSSEYDLQAEETDTLSSNSAGIGALEGTGLEPTTELRNAVGATNDRASSFSQTPGHGRVTVIAPRGAESTIAMRSSPRAAGEGEATQQYPAENRPGAPEYQSDLGDGSQQVPRDRTSDGSLNRTSPRADTGSIAAQTQADGDPQEAIVRADNAVATRVNRSTVAGYAIAFVIVAGAVAARMLLVR
jgi:hypothetical protein